MTGGPMHQDVQNIISNLSARNSKLGQWNAEASIRAERPKMEISKNQKVKISPKQLYGDGDWQENVRDSLNFHFAKDGRLPKVEVGVIASSDRLVKDTAKVKNWQQVARQMLAIEMELAGVYRAVRQRGQEYPLLAVRGISDIVGLDRKNEWTTYACHSAAAFAVAFLKTRPIPPRP